MRVCVHTHVHVGRMTLRGSLCITVWFWLILHSLLFYICVIDLQSKQQSPWTNRTPVVKQKPARYTGMFISIILCVCACYNHVLPPLAYIAYTRTCTCRMTLCGSLCITVWFWLILHSLYLCNRPAEQAAESFDNPDPRGKAKASTLYRCVH